MTRDERGEAGLGTAAVVFLVVLVILHMYGIDAVGYIADLVKWIADKVHQLGGEVPQPPKGAE